MSIGGRCYITFFKQCSAINTVGITGITVLDTVFEFYIDNLNMAVLLPVGVGAVLTFVLLTRAVDWMMNNRYNVMFHGIIGLVIAATIFTIPFAAFTASVSSCLIHLVFVVLGCVATLLLDKFNSKVEKPPVEE